MPDEISVLFVDDEDGIRLTLPPVLEKHGFRVTAAATVPEALRLIAEHKFHVLLTDLNIGHVGDGFAVVSAMRSTQPDALRFIITGYPAFESSLEALRQQVDDYVVKPADTAELAKKIRSKLERRTPSRAVPPKRVPDVIEGNIATLVEAFLEVTKADPEFNAISLSDSQRTDHIPRLLEVAIRIARRGTISAQDEEASVLHGKTRREQGYTAALLIREARILKRNVADVVHRNLLEINISYVITDLVTILETVDTLLEKSVGAFTAQPTRDSDPTRITRT